MIDHICMYLRKRLDSGKEYFRICPPGSPLCYGSKVMSILRQRCLLLSRHTKTEKWVIFCNFDCRKLLFMQDKYDIRNQHEKIHQKLYFLRKIFSIKILALVPLSLLFFKFSLWFPRGKILMENILHKK